jgi:hypothetical protein
MTLNRANSNRVTNSGKKNMANNANFRIRHKCAVSLRTRQKAGTQPLSASPSCDVDIFYSARRRLSGQAAPYTRTLPGEEPDRVELYVHALLDNERDIVHFATGIVVNARDIDPAGISPKADPVAYRAFQGLKAALYELHTTLIICGSTLTANHIREAIDEWANGTCWYDTETVRAQAIDRVLDLRLAARILQAEARRRCNAIEVNAHRLSRPVLGDFAH